MAGTAPSRADSLRLDLANECVWRREQSIQFAPTAFALVRYLAERPGQLVSKDELLAAVWPEVVVSENTLATHIGAIRQALGSVSSDINGFGAIRVCSAWTTLR
jgi:DNA-binding winged helix-turn-helix (wHTH) protein